LGSEGPGTGIIVSDRHQGKTAMKDEYAMLSHIQLAPATTYACPPEPPAEVDLDSPAVDVMTDLDLIHAVTIGPQAVIDDALEHMKTKGVRLLLVTNEREEIVGLITAKDIQGERPVKLAAEARIARSGITVRMIMTPQEELVALNLISVRNARVGHVVATLNHFERQHMLVVEVDAATRFQRLRGIFSTSQISKQLGRDVTRMTGAAHSLAELQHEIG
jgi:CBS-domain-containing membrane protein